MPALGEPLRRRGLALVAAHAPAAVRLLHWMPGDPPVGTLLAAHRRRGPAALLVLCPADAVAIALDTGADDAADCDSDAEALAARCAALVRRGRRNGWRLGELELDPLARAAHRAYRPLSLSPREYALLHHLAQHAGTPVSRQALLQAVWNLAHDPGTNLVAVHVSRLRAKLDRGFATPMLLTEGGGYRLAP